MSYEVLVAWLLLMFPMVYSPGPANTMFASNGAIFGLKRSLPFLAGIDIAFVLQSFFVGFSMSLLLMIPYFFEVLRLAGILYISYLGFKFLKAATTTLQNQESCLGFKDGMVLTAINPKAWIMQVMMFSQFLDVHAVGLPQVALFAFLLCILNISGHIIWILFGSMLLSRATSIFSTRLQNIVFAMMLFGSIVFLI